jgi:hypothetical protein
VTGAVNLTRSRREPHSISFCILVKAPRFLLGLGASFALSTSLFATESSDAFVAALTASFSTWDSDHDGILSMSEIDHALADASIKGDTAVALGVVKRIARDKKWSSISRTLPELTGLAAKEKSASVPNVGTMFAEGRKHLAGTERVLFTESAPRLAVLCQGTMGNCFSLAPLGSMLSRDPEQVKAMFKDNNDGTYNVHIGATWIHVDAPTDAEITLSSRGGDTGLWSNVYEKAVGVARNNLRPERDRATTPLDAIARGGSAGTMLAFITGHEMERFTLKWAKDAKTTPEETEAKLKELRQKLTVAFSEHRCVTTGTLTPSMPGLRGGHAYGVLAYNQATDEIRLWDPHGDAFTPAGDPGLKTGFPRNEGICDMPLAVFVKQFSGLAFELMNPPVAGN